MNTATDRDLATAILARFRGREDYVAVPNGKGFKPQELTAPLTAERFEAQHLGGRGCLGLYLMRTDNTVLCTVVDFDNKLKNLDPKWREKTEEVVDHLEGLGLVPLVEMSQSGHASHVWLFFLACCPAWLVLRFWDKVAAAVGFKFKEVYPRQDRLTEDGLGNLIRYPLWNKSRFIDVGSDWATIDRLEALESIETIDPGDFRELCARIGVDLTPPADASSNGVMHESSGKEDTGNTLILVPSAEPPTAKLVALVSNVSEFAEVWNHKRKFPSNSERELSLAWYATEAGWTDQEIANLIIAHRRTHAPDRIKRVLQLSYMVNTIGKARSGKPESVGVTDAKALESLTEDGQLDRDKIDDGVRQGILESMSVRLKVPVAGWQQQGREKPIYILILKGGRKVVIGGEAAMFSSCRIARQRVAAEAGILMDSITPKEWAIICKAMLKIVDVVENPSADTDAGKMRDWLMAYVSVFNGGDGSRGGGCVGLHLRTEKFDDAYFRAIAWHSKAALYENGELSVYLDNFVQYVNFRICPGMKWTREMAVRSFRAAGGEPKSLNVVPEGCTTRTTQNRFFFNVAKSLPEVAAFIDEARSR